MSEYPMNHHMIFQYPLCLSIERKKFKNHVNLDKRLFESNCIMKFKYILTDETL